VLGGLGYFSTGFILFGALIFAGSIIPFFLKLLKEDKVEPDARIST
jgi:hypothetical protein